MRPIPLLFAAALWVTAPVAAQPTFDRFADATGAAHARDGHGAVSIAVVRDGKLVASRHLGSIRAGSVTVPDDRTLYRLGSVTKAFTALMLLQLEERGVVRLSDPVIRWVPELRRVRGNRADLARITLFQLATHASGLAPEPDKAGFDRGPARDWERQLTAALASTRLTGEPGTAFGYSNIGYGLLGLALSRATRQRYTDYVLAHIIRPLEMVDTTFEPTPDQRQRTADGLTVEKDVETVAERPASSTGRGYKVPVGGLYSTTADMARFVAFQMGSGPEKVLRRASLERASKLWIGVDRGMGEGYGLGLQLFTNGDAVLQGHTGGLPGYRAVELFDRESRTGFVLLRNVTGGRFGDPVMTIFAAYPPAGEGQ